ncbi:MULTISPECIES: hypothetical protein [unclassified Chelatococcus]|uniref:hypothetical protein n=1 Tax=unclassified Chelatococcus TaxID=2638111 RepID=UPI001BD0D6F5|nr:MULTISPECIES: hypothetical protein [unclassified Chelatococcus]CAH1657546.1 conserved hypothetical protein [Hyphomicrobiales bacterium]MBS7740696.1 hypothetical protein [Chelatococcus sp. HY11]MBX3546070.1 hypothetical protein [Chelatococcus sp.]MCO5079819.1 hypothetical protein [Chelatococcus sp.]CAH1684394.1 conserved hypothetical protein [Hyphomicrobiales bacterium]
MNSRYGDTNWDEDSEFTRLADAISGKRAAPKGVPLKTVRRQGPVPHPGRPDHPGIPHHRVHLRAIPEGQRRRQATTSKRVNVGLIALGLLAAATGALLTHKLLEQPVIPEVGEERSDPLDYTIKPTPAVDALGQALPIWVRLAKPAVTVVNPAPALKTSDVAYETWQHGLGGQRDTTVFGHFADGLYVFLSFYRQGEEAQAAPTFFVDAARQAAEAGIGVIRTDVPAARATKFGPTEMANGVLTNGTLRRDCLVFRNRGQGGGLTLSGWACGAADRPIDADTLACMIDGTGFTSSDTALNQHLAASEAKRRPACINQPATPAKPPQRRS